MIESNADKVQRIVASEPQEADSLAIENSLRPGSLKEYIGQRAVKENLQIAIDAAKQREETLDHILLHGPPGLGKTTLANVIANEIGKSLRITSGPALERQGDLASILSNLEEGEVLFIDEIHRLRPNVEEVLYSAMEDFVMDIVLGKGPSARTMTLKFPRFNIIGATTKISMISSPLRDRFGSLFKLQFYSEEDIAEILLRSSGILGCNLEPVAAERLASSSRKTPRVANRLLKRVRDYGQVFGHPKIDEEVLAAALNKLGVDPLGLDERDREILQVIIEKFAGGPVGLGTLAAAISEEKNTLEDVYEPFLIRLGLLERTHRGRAVTGRAYQHLGL